MKKRPKCETCELKGYSPDFCRVHAKKIASGQSEDCFLPVPLKNVGKAATIGAGVGVMVTTIGIAAVPILWVKAAIGHHMAATIGAGGGAGAGIGLARKVCKQEPEDKQGRRELILLI